MRVLRRIAVVLVAGSVLSGVPSVARASSDCVLACPPPARNSAPVSGAVTVSDLGPTSARFTATLNPGGLRTTYYFLVSAATTDASERTATRTLETTSTTTVSAKDDRLEPHGRYYFQLVAQNSAGTNTGPLGNLVATPVAPALPIRMVIHRNKFLIGESLSFTGITSGATFIDPFDLGYLQDSSIGSSKFVRYTDPFEQDAPTVGAHGRIQFPATALRNARWRAVLSGGNNGFAAVQFADGPIRRRSHSKPVLVYVYPRLGFGSYRPDNGLTIRVVASAVVHRLRRGYRGEPVYIYISSSAHGPWRRIGHPRLRPAGVGEFLGSENLQASTSYKDPNAVYIRGCVRHEILRDMGTPFFDSACGARNIKSFR